MANKKTLDELIMEVLSEDISIDLEKIKGVMDRKAALSVGKRLRNIDIERVANKKPKESVLDDEDFVAAFKSGKDSEVRKSAELIFQSTKDDQIRDAITKAIAKAAQEQDKKYEEKPIPIAQKSQGEDVLKKYLQLTRASISDSKTLEKAQDILRQNKNLGAGLGVPDIKLDQKITTKGNAEEFLRLAGKQLGTSNNIEEAIKKICNFCNGISQGTYKYEASNKKGKISELLSRMMLVQGMLSAIKGFEGSPSGFLMEGFFALLIQGQVAGSNQEGEDFVHVKNNKVELYSSKFKQLGESQKMRTGPESKQIDIGANTAKSLKSYIGTKDSTKFPGQEVSKTITYIFGLKDRTDNPKVVHFFKAPYKKNDLSGTTLNDDKMKAIPGATLDLSDASIEAMYQNFAVLATSLQVDLNAIYKSMNNFKIFVNTYFLGWDPIAAQGAAAEFAVMKKEINAGFATGGGTTRLSESKTKSIKDLDKLIEQVILEHINK
jgi:hypothetical protein